MKQLLKDIQNNKLLWLLAFVPVVFVAQQLTHDAHTLLFVLSVLAIVPLTVLLSLATVSVAAKTGDAIGGLLNATLGNLAELVIALAALRAGQYMLVKASIAGTIVTNTLFILGASFLLGGLKHHEQEYNRVSARMQAGLLFLATVALLIPSAISHADTAEVAFSNKLSVGLAVLLIVTYGLSTLFSLKSHRESFGSVQHAEVGRPLLGASGAARPGRGAAAAGPGSGPGRVRPSRTSKGPGTARRGAGALRGGRRSASRPRREGRRR